jgi:hypothetical protein
VRASRGAVLNWLPCPLQVTMKGSDGVFGVLPGHVPTISQLQPGTVSVEYEEDGVTQVRVYCRTIPVLVARVLADLAEIHRCCAAQSTDFFVCVLPKIFRRSQRRWRKYTHPHPHHAQIPLLAVCRHLLQP